MKYVTVLTSAFESTTIPRTVSSTEGTYCIEKNKLEYQTLKRAMGNLYSKPVINHKKTISWWN